MVLESVTQQPVGRVHRAYREVPRVADQWLDAMAPTHGHTQQDGHGGALVDAQCQCASPGPVMLGRQQIQPRQEPIAGILYEIQVHVLQVVSPRTRS